MSFKVFDGYLANIDQLQSEEAALSLKIANDPKAVYLIDYEKSKSAIGKLEAAILDRVNGKIVKPYYEDEEIDHAGLANLKATLNANRR